MWSVSFCSTCCSARRTRMRTWRWRRVNSGWLWRSSPSVKRLCQDTWSSEYCRPSSSSPHTSEHTPNTQMKPLFSSVWEIWSELLMIEWDDLMLMYFSTDSSPSWSTEWSILRLTSFYWRWVTIYETWFRDIPLNQIMFIALVEFAFT